MPQNLSLVDPYTAPSRVSGQRVNFQFWRQPVYELQDGTLWCPGIDGKTFFEDAHSRVNVGGMITPGIARVRVTKSAAVDEKKAAGQDGARLTRHGFNPASIEIDLTIWTPDQCRALDKFWTAVFLNPDPLSVAAINVVTPVGGGFGAAQQLAFAAQHPELSRHGVASIMFVGGDGIEIDAQGRGLFRIRAAEFVPIKKQGKTVTQTPVAAIGSKLDDQGAIPTTPNGYAMPGQDPANLGPR